MLETFLKLVSQCPEEDIEIVIDHEQNKKDITFFLTVLDYSGYDEEWNEIMRILSKRTEGLLNWLKKWCPYAFENDNNHPICKFSNFTVIVSYDSSNF